jgi:hypothetical protein
MLIEVYEDTVLLLFNSIKLQINSSAGKVLVQLLQVLVEIGKIPLFVIKISSSSLHIGHIVLALYAV